MRILYHLTIPPPQMPECEAISQEIDALCAHFGGALSYINPNRQSPIYVPRLLFGFHQLRQLRTQEKDFDLHQLYNPDPFPFPILYTLRRPIIYSLTGGVTHKRVNAAFFAKMAAVTVTDERSLTYLESHGLNNVFRVHPGIDTRRFTHTPTPLESEIRLMVGSAPWTKGQFKTKGVDALLEAAQRMPELRLIFLWRGVLMEEMERRVRGMGLQERVSVLNEYVDVNRVLAGVHASVTLATEPDIVKAYPHSLLESLAAGKPVLVSRAIPMAEYVERTGCGTVVEAVSTAAVIRAVRGMAQAYHTLQATTRRVGRQAFSQERLVDSYRRIYEHILAGTH
jgi:glycosyltransferase involved in cell wall biosynthesis